jgi:predicted nuclease with TOPRIM domain
MTSLVTAINTKADLQEVYNKTQIDEQYDSMLDELNAAYDYVQDVEAKVTSLNNDIESLTNRVEELEKVLDTTPSTPVTPPVTQTYDCASEIFNVKANTFANTTYKVGN